MIIKSIKLKNFKCYEDYQVQFSDMTFIKGKNGKGKTTLGLDALLFVLYGYSNVNLTDVPKRDKSKSCSVEVELAYKDDIYLICRKIPTRVIIKRNGEELEFASGAEASQYLKRLFGDVTKFKKFRMIDNEKGINFLEEGNITLKKILFSNYVDIFNKVRDRLQQLKREREVYNKDTAIVEPYYPSQKRLDIVNNTIIELEDSYNPLLQQKRELQQDLINYKGRESKLNYQKNQTKQQRDKLLQESVCYTCKQSLTPTNKDELLSQKNKEIIELNGNLNDVQLSLQEINEISQQIEHSIEKIQPKIIRLNGLKHKLETRIKQKEYIYTTKDVEVIKRAIKELDNLSTNYLVSSLKMLEPIINEILEKIGFNLKFEINRDKFNITLTKGDVQYNYKDLSTGQKLVLQIAFKLAILLEKGEEGIVIADEGMSSLDRDNLLYILQIFENYPFQLVFILHNFNEPPDNIKIIDLDKE